MHDDDGGDPQGSICDRPKRSPRDRRSERALWAVAGELGHTTRDPSEVLAEPQPPWQRPNLKRVGNLRDFVLGAGKAGSQLDMDPQMALKSGIG